MDDRSQNLVKQLSEKTSAGKIRWTTGFEDGQFKALLPNGELAFVVQAKGDVRRFAVLDDQQETVLEESIAKVETEREPAHQPKLMLFLAIGKLQELARSQALQVNEKLDRAERILALI